MADGFQWDRATNRVTPIAPGKPQSRNQKNRKKVKLVSGKKKLKKGAVQDGLQGMRMPEVASIFGLTGVQSMGPATGGMRPVGSTVPSNQAPSSVPGTTASLLGGQSAYQVPAEAGIDLTLSKKAQKKIQKELSRRLKAFSLLKQRLAMLEPKQRNNALARSASAVASVTERRMRNIAEADGGSVVKALAAIDPAEVAGATADVSRVLGISDSAARWAPQQLDALTQLRRILSGPPESLAGAQNSAAAGVGGPAAQLGQVLKNGGLREELAAAEAEVRKAEASGDQFAVSRAHEALTLARLKLVHRAGAGI